MPRLFSRDHTILTLLVIVDDDVTSFCSSCGVHDNPLFTYSYVRTALHLLFIIYLKINF